MSSCLCMFVLPCGGFSDGTGAGGALQALIYRHLQASTKTHGDQVLRVTSK